MALSPFVEISCEEGLKKRWSKQINSDEMMYVKKVNLTQKTTICYNFSFIQLFYSKMYPLSFIRVAYQS